MHADAPMPTAINPFAAEFSKQVRRKLVDLRLTQKSLLPGLKVSASTLNRYINLDRKKSDFKNWPSDLMDELAQVLGISLDGIRSRMNRKDKGPVPSVDPRIELSHLPIPLTPELFGRQQYLKRLDACWKDLRTNVITVVGPAGVGKSALVHHWRLQMQERQWDGAEYVFGYSFFSQGTRDGPTSSDDFFNTALPWFQGVPPYPGTPWAKAEMLADLIRARRALLILDGLEPLQFPPGAEGGRLRDRAVRHLLLSLSVANPGLCLITTRLGIADLPQREPGVVEIIPEELEAIDGAELLRSLLGNDRNRLADLVDASREFGGNGLALTLLGSYLRLVKRGDIRRRDTIGPLVEDPQNGGHARRVMASYERWFGEGPELAILRLLGLFDRPADGSAIAKLREKPAVRGLTDSLVKLSQSRWQTALSNLRKAKLLAPEDRFHPDTLDAHPLVREHFRKQVEERLPRAWKEGNRRLYGYYQLQPHEDRPQTAEEMAPLYAAMLHGCRAGKHIEAYREVYRRRIVQDRGDTTDHTSWKKLGLVASDLAALAGLFVTPWNQLKKGFREAEVGDILVLVGFFLRSMGRLEDAVEPICQALSTHERLAGTDKKQWREAGNDADNLAQISLLIGNLERSRLFAERSVEIVANSHLRRDKFQIMFQATLGDVLHQLGLFAEAEQAFMRAEKWQAAWHLNRPFLRSGSGFRYCDLLLSLGRSGEVKERAEQLLIWAKLDDSTPLERGFAHFSKGRAHLLEREKKQSKAELIRALHDLRDVGIQDLIARCLIALASAHSANGERSHAVSMLEEATNICKQNDILLLEADCHLERCRMHLREKELAAAQTEIGMAKTIANEIGYRRRDREIAELFRRCA